MWYVVFYIHTSCVAGLFCTSFDEWPSLPFPPSTLYMWTIWLFSILYESFFFWKDIFLFILYLSKRIFTLSRGQIL
ncbi:hypothetical protein F4775DRAFT_556292 [Biscogniauxia sp. FL1348]|nr:hypothetical protein F4775DRAFT_556292 [Biscogniauxia sp. FL1348]